MLCWLTQVVMEKRPLNVCSSSCSSRYDIWPGNGHGLFLFWRFISMSPTSLLRHLPTYLQPTWGSFGTREEKLTENRLTKVHLQKAITWRTRRKSQFDFRGQMHIHSSVLLHLYSLAISYFKSIHSL